MGQITLRGLDLDVERKIREEAKLTGKSINKYIIDIICKDEQFRKADTESKASSLKKLSGGWSQQEADEFYESIQILEQVDEKLWA